MTDREKIIKGLNEIGGFVTARIGFEQARNFMHTIDDALELIKQGTVKPKLVRDWYVCECGASITVDVDGEPLHKANYCAGCGRQIDWGEGVNK